MSSDIKLLDYLHTHVWAMERRAFGRLLDVVSRHAEGVTLDSSEIEAITEKRDREAKVEDARVENGVAIIPISGVIAPHARMVNDVSQPRGTSVEAVRNHFRRALADDSVHTVLFDVESPGGSVQGVDDLAEEIREARGAKRIVAHTDSLMASAAMWISAQANEVYATRSADVGSIGVYAVVDDYSEAFEKQGVKTHVISSGGVKGAAIRGTKVTEEQLEDMQSSIDATNDLFIEAMSAGRKRDRKAVAKWNTGQTWLGTKAADMGLIDGVATFEGLLGRLQSEGGSPAAVTDLAACAADDSSTEGGEMTEQVNDAPQLTAEDIETARTAGVELERARVKAIRECAHPSQRELADELIEDGVDTEQAMRDLHADLFTKFDELSTAKAVEAPKAAAKSQELYGDANTPTVFGATEEAEGVREVKQKLESRDLATMSDAELAKAAATEWEARSEELQAEYMSFEGWHGWLMSAREQGVNRG